MSSRTLTKQEIDNHLALMVKAGTVLKVWCHVIVIACLFTKLPWLVISEGTFWSLSQAPDICPSVYHTRWKPHILSVC